jgi:hypothetical protein
MVSAPPLTPNTTPVEDTDVWPEEALHVPPGTVAAIVTVAVWHTEPGTAIRPGEGSEFTVRAAVLLQPEPIVYVIFAVPADTPVTTPDEAAAVATVGAPLVQEPPVVALAIVMLDPSQTLAGPVIAAGSGFTFTVATL